MGTQQVVINRYKVTTSFDDGIPVLNIFDITRDDLKHIWHTILDRFKLNRTFNLSNVQHAKSTYPVISLDSIRAYCDRLQKQQTMLTLHSSNLDTEESEQPSTCWKQAFASE